MACEKGMDFGGKGQNAMVSMFVPSKIHMLKTYVQDGKALPSTEGPVY